MADRVFKHLYNLQYVRTRQNRSSFFNLALYHSFEEQHEDPFPYEWYEKAFAKLTKWGNLLKNVDLIDGRLVNISDYSIVNNSILEVKMNNFKALARAFISCPSVQETLSKNIMGTLANESCTPPIFFGRKNEREPMTVDSLTKVSNFLNISAQKRKGVRLAICPQITQHQIWTGALVEILNGLKSELDSVNRHHQRKETKMAQQVVALCLKFLDTAISYDPESTSWMRLKPTKKMDSSVLHKWGDILEMFNDLINCLRDEKEMLLHFTKLDIMKEGLHQIKDVCIDKNIGYKETRHHAILAQKKLTRTLGHSSRCLFTLLLYYLNGCVRDFELELCGGLYKCSDGNRFILYMGKILTSSEDMMVRSGVKQLDRVLGMFKFIWESAELKGTLELQGHLFCNGAENRSFTYRGSVFFVHEIGL